MAKIHLFGTSAWHSTQPLKWTECGLLPGKHEVTEDEDEATCRRCQYLRSIRKKAKEGK